MQKNEEGTQFTKIAIDEKTQEPSIVIVDESELPNEIAVDLPKKKKGLPDVVIKHARQIKMSEVIGFKTDKSIDRRKRILKNIVTVLFIAFVLAVLVYTAINDFTRGKIVSTDEVLATLKNNWYYFVFAVLSTVIFFLAKGGLRSAVCRSVTGRFMYPTAFNAGVVCQFYNNITPLAMGGQPFEISYLVKKGIDGGHASTITISTYLINMFVYAGLFLYSLLAYVYNWLGFDYEVISFESIEAIKIAAIVGTAFSLVAPLLILIFSIYPKLGAILVNFYVWLVSKLRLTKNPAALKYKVLRPLIVNARSTKALIKKPLILGLATLFSLLEAIANASIAYFTLRFFGFDWVQVGGFMEWLQIITIVILITAASSFIPTPGSSGAVDFSFYTMFSKQLAVGFAFPAMLSWRLLNFYLIIVFGFIYVRTAIKKDLAKHGHS